MSDKTSALEYLQLLSDQGKRDELQVAVGRCSAKELRSYCLGLGARVRSKDYAAYHTKAGYAELVMQLLTAKSVHKGLADSSDLKPIAVQSSNSTRRSKNCNLRLTNVMFSDTLQPFLNDMNAVPTQQEVDAGAVDGDSPFWKRVQLEFTSNKPQYGSVAFPEECFRGFNLSTPMQHSSKKLREMWEELCTAFASVSARFSGSETPEMGFLAFCLNRFDLYYLHCWLQVKPNLLAMATGGSSVRPEVTSDNETEGVINEAGQRQCRKRKTAAMDRLVRAVEAVARPRILSIEEERVILMQRIKEACETLALVRSNELGSELEGIVLCELQRHAKRLKRIQGGEIVERITTEQATARSK